MSKELPIMSARALLPQRGVPIMSARTLLIAMVWNLLACGLNVVGSACADFGEADSGKELHVAHPEIAKDANDGGEPAPVDIGPVSDAGSASDASPVPYAAEVLADNPVAYWRLDEPSGSLVAKDTTKGARTGTVSGAVTWRAPGALADGNTAAAFGSGSGCIDVGHMGGLSGAFTVEMWVSWSMADRDLIRQAGPPLTQGWDLRLSAGPSPQLILDSGQGGAIAVPAPPPKVFTHVVAVANGQAATLYLNGVPAGQGAMKGTSTTQNHSLTFGCDPRGSFEGSLDEVAIYVHALPEARVQAHYWAGKGFP